MAIKQSEAIVLRSYPLREADLLVTLLTRTDGKVKGVARAAKKSKKRFGGALEPLTYVKAYWDDREGHELARLDACEVLESPLADEVDYPRAVALGYVAEVLDQVLPDREPNDAMFRLALAVLSHLRAGVIWMPLTYFDLWIVRLMGLLPELHECIECGTALNGSRAWFHPLADGLMCVQHKRLASTEMQPESRALAAEMFRLPIDKFAGQPWRKQQGLDLRKFLSQRIERQLEKKLVTGAMLERLD
ncbi:MAG TPA: DNA repair protein RecO [Terriglobales bacterium]|nr:DNA repair protein RecO [Terriglobales bacterium]